MLSLAEYSYSSSSDIFPFQVSVTFDACPPPSSTHGGPYIIIGMSIVPI